MFFTIIVAAVGMLNLYLMKNNSRFELHTKGEFRPGGMAFG